MIPGTIEAPAEHAAALRAAEAEALAAAGTFGAALRASPEFVALVLTADTLAIDGEAQAAIRAFRDRQAELRVEITLGSLDLAQREGLERLQSAMLACPPVAAYIAAQGAFQAVCRETASVVSAQIGIDFAANCRAGGCCG